MSINIIDKFDLNSIKRDKKPIKIITFQKLNKKEQSEKLFEIIDLNCVFSDKEKNEFVNSYLNLIGQIGKENNSLGWWASYISSKNIFMSKCFSDVYEFCCLAHYILENLDENIYIYRPKKIIFSQLLTFLDEKGIEYDINFRSRDSFLMKNIEYVSNTMLFLIKTSVKITFSKLLFSKRLKKLTNEKKRYYVIRSWFYSGTISDDKGYYDSFFGPLPGYLSDYTDLLIVAGIFNDYMEVIKKIRKEKEYNIIPEETFLSFPDPIKAIFFARKIKIRIEEPQYIDEIDVSEILKSALETDYRYNLKDQLIQYYINKKLVDNLKVDTYLTTYENNPWEKVVILTLKEFSPDTMILGFQHTLLNNSSINFRLSDIEKEIIPTPNLL